MHKNLNFSKQKLKAGVLIATGILVLSLLAFWIQKVLGNYETEILSFTESLGIWGPIFLCLGVAFGGIFVPMTSLPFTLVGIALFDYWQVFLIYYIGNTLIAPAADFYIARKWGRGAVEKFAGKKALTEIDRFANVAGYKILVALRIVGGVLFDSVSYAVGLTTLSFRKVMLITAIAAIPGQLWTIYILEKSVDQSPLFLSLLLVTAYGGGIIASVLLYRAEKRKGEEGKIA